MAFQARSFGILSRYFSGTPEARIRQDMARFCPELSQEGHDGAPYLRLIPDEPDPVEVVRMPSGWWRRFMRFLFGR